MKQKLSYIIVTALWLACILRGSTSFGQELIYHESFDRLDSNANYSFLGKTKDRILILKTLSPGFPSLHILDSIGKEHQSVTITAPGLNKAFKPQAMFTQDTISLFYQYRSGNYIYQNLLLLDLNGRALAGVIKLDSARSDILREGALMQFIPIPAESKILLYRLILGLNPGKLIVDHATYSSAGVLIDKANTSINFDRTLQEISAVHLHSNGNAYFTIYDKPDPYRLYSNLTLYQLNASSATSKIRDIPYKGIKPVRPVFVKTTMPSSFLGLCSIYFEKDSWIPNGVLVTEVDVAKKTEPVINRFFPLQQTHGKYNKAGSFKLPVAYRPARNDKLVLYAAFQTSNGEWNFLMENSYAIINTSSSFSNSGQANNSSVTVNNFTPSQEMDQIRDQAIQNINYSSNNSSGTYRFGNQGNNNVTQLGGVNNNFTMNNGYLDQLEKSNEQLPFGTEDLFYSNEFKESQKLIHYFITVKGDKGVKNHLKFQSTIISKQLPLQSIKIMNDSSVLIVDIGTNSDRFDFKSIHTNDRNWRKEFRSKKEKTLLWRESILNFHQRLFLLCIDERNGTIGLASINE